jgi:hypothetical protein
MDDIWLHSGVAERLLVCRLEVGLGHMLSKVENVVLALGVR